MDVPKTRYRVIERDRKLIVIDTWTGDPATKAMPLPASPSARSPGLPRIAIGRGVFDRLALACARIGTKGRDAQGRALVRWDYKVNNKPRRWEAALDPAQELRFGRALMGLASFPATFLALFVPGVNMFAVLLLLPTLLWALWSFVRLSALQKETGLR